MKNSKMNVLAVFLCGLMGLLALCGCDDGTKIDAKNAGPGMYDILARHDAYVNGDQGLSPTQKQIYLRSSALVKNMLDTALKSDKKGTDTSTSTSKSTSVDLLDRDYGHMEALQRLAYDLRKDQCAKEHQKLNYDEFAHSGPNVVTKDMVCQAQTDQKPEITEGMTDCEKCVVLEKAGGGLKWVRKGAETTGSVSTNKCPALIGNGSVSTSATIQLGKSVELAR